MKLRNILLNGLSKYARDSAGQFAVWFAISAFPVLVATSFVIDLHGAEADRSAIKRALDASVLAAVSNNRVDFSGKEGIAKSVFEKHYDRAAELQLQVSVSDGRVEMNAKGDRAATIARAVGAQSFGIDETSVAEMNRQNTICVLALAAEGDEKLRFLDSTMFSSPTCSVQSNSRSAYGALSSSKHAPIAKSFCSAGGASGAFSPSIRGECRQIADPYAARNAPLPGLCVPSDVFQTKSLTDSSLVGGLLGTVGQLLGVLRLDSLGLTNAQITRVMSDYGDDLLGVAESTNYTGANMVLSPGTYCGGLTVDGQNVTFLPGIYILKDGPLTFKNGAQASAQDVSFVLHGVDAVVTVETGSYVNIKAPRTGPTAGLAFFQDQNVKTAGLKKTELPPTGVNLLSSGGELNVTGTMYFPTQALEVIGNSVLGANAPATSFIAHQVTFAGETQAEVRVDHVKGGIPPMLPRSDDGARLVQ